MLSLFTRNIPLTFLALSLLVNIFLLFLANEYREDIKALKGDIVSREQSLRDCQKANQGWEESYDLLLESCEAQSQVIISLSNDLQEEREGSGEVIREILLLVSEESGNKGGSPSVVPSSQINGESNERKTYNSPPVAGLDDRLPDSLYNALQRSYNGSETPATPNP